jgi:hypothetical protein
VVVAEGLGKPAKTKHMVVAVVGTLKKQFHCQT